MSSMNRMKELIALLNEASRKYYQEDTEIMSNREYDALYDELLTLEDETGTVLAGSPTQKVGYEILSSLPKKAHARRMLSLNKTKSVEELAAFLGSHEGVLSWKLDGLTVVLTYEGGVLSEALTRGNGEVGEVITPNARTFENIPKKIPFSGKLVLRGEAVISYNDFEKINASLGEEEEPYKNPRNLCSGSVRQLNSEITAKRHVNCHIFAVVSAEGIELPDRFSERLEWVRGLGFEPVDYRRVRAGTIAEAVEEFAEEIVDYPLPSDGLVLLFNDSAYGESLGETAKYPRNAIAFKWKDEISETVLRAVEWSPSRTGRINPVAIFDPVEIEGTTVSRASLHNISIVEELKLGIGDRITVFKANMIIPQVFENLTKSDTLEIPTSCPTCHERAEIRMLNESKELICTNIQCPEKLIGSMEHYVSRNAMNIDGLSVKTLETFLAAGILKEIPDLYRLPEKKDEILALGGFGEKSYSKLVTSVDASRTVTAGAFLNALGIPGVGEQMAKIIADAFSDDWRKIVSATEEELMSIDGVGAVIAQGYVDFFANEKNQELVRRLEQELTVVKRGKKQDNEYLNGKTLVITGSLEYFENRDALKELLERAGAKVTGSVSKKTDYLVNNDVNSTSSKNRKAKELGIPVITEDRLRIWLGE